MLQPRLGSGLPYSIPRGAYETADGEWIAEGWVVMNAFAVWSVVLWLVTAAQLRLPQAPDTAFAAA